jgi:hypothetical protein
MKENEAIAKNQREVLLLGNFKSRGINDYAKTSS